MIVSLAEAEGQLAKLIELARAGEDVLIEQPDHSIVRLVPVVPQPPPEPGRRRTPGGWEHLKIPDSAFFDPMTEDELAEWE